MANPNLQFVCLSFEGVKHYRRFAFLPRVGDKIAISDNDAKMYYELVAKEVWFDDKNGEDTCIVTIMCSVHDQSEFGTE